MRRGSETERQGLEGGRRSRLRLALTILALWTAIGLFNGSQIFYRVPFGPTPRRFTFWEVTGPQLLRAYVWAAWTPFVVGLVRRFPLSWARRVSRLATASAHAGALVAFPVSAAVASFFLTNLLTGAPLVAGAIPGRPFVDSIALTLSFHVLVHVGVVAAVLGIGFARETRAAELLASRLSAELFSARLATLQTQIHPHFVLNALGGVLPLVTANPPAAQRMVSELGELLKTSLGCPSAFTTLGEELDFVKRYLGIQTARFQDRLTVLYEVEPGLSHVGIPSFVLQPLVENSIRHGLAVRPGPSRLEVRASRSGERLVLQVKDDGPGAPSGPDVSRSSGIGLANTRKRLRLVYGDEHTFKAQNRPEGGFEVRIELPRREMREANQASAQAGHEAGA